MIQGNLFDGGGKESQAEYDRKRWAARKAKGLCKSCPAPAVPGKVRCRCCADKEAKRRAERRAKRIAAGVCEQCGRNPIADSSGRECVQCLERGAGRDQARRSTDGARWLGVVGNKTRRVAIGALQSCKQLPWTNADFAVRFVDWEGETDRRNIDHIIPRKCAITLDGSRDEAFGALAFGLENLQLLTQSGNIRKGLDLDPLILARSNELRHQGLSGAPLFHTLWAEFSEAAQGYGDMPE